MVILLNTYSPRNAGDLALVEVALDVIRSGASYPGTIGLQGRRALEFLDTLSDGFGQMEEYHPSWEVPAGVTGLARIIVDVVGAIRSLSPLLAASGASRKLRGKPSVFSVGGGYLYSSPKSLISRDLVNRLFVLLEAASHGCEVVVLPVSIGPFRNWVDEWLTRLVLSRVKVVFCRDRASYLWCLKNGISALLLCDHAWALPTPKAVERGRRSEAGVITVGITVVDPALFYGQIGWRERYFEEIASMLRSLAAHRAVSVNVYVHVDVSSYDSDAVATDMLCRRLQPIQFRKIVTAGLPLAEVLALYGQCDVFVGSRMHSCIFSLIMGIPTVGLAYQPKHLGLFNQIGLERYVLLMETFDSFGLLAVVTELLDRGQDVAGVERAREMAKDLFSKLAESSLLPEITGSRCGKDI